jgi:hypothetical protein
MAEREVIADLATALAQRRFPTVTVWNRLEGRPRAEDFDRALGAELGDPLWMLTRQWQVGELRGEDAGSPVSARVHMTTERLSGYGPGDAPLGPFPRDTPLEAQAERRPVPFAFGGQDAALDLRLALGRQWLRMLAAEVGDFRDDYRTRYPLTEPDPGRPEDAPVAAHAEAWQRVAAVAGRMMDGFAFYSHVRGGGDATDGIGVPGDRADDVRALAERLVNWFDDLLLQPAAGEPDAWDPAAFEYRFSLGSGTGADRRSYTAAEHRGGHLDWYSFDPAPPGGESSPAGAWDSDVPVTTRASFLPTAIGYEGMPDPRWWTFEDRRVDFGDVHAGTTEIGKLLVLEFGLIHAGDWFLVPHSVPAGVRAGVHGLAVTNTFGERFWIEPAGGRDGAGPDAWAMFANRARDGDRDSGLLVLPTVPGTLEGEPREQVTVLRDEMANMVWGVETTVWLPSGEPRPGQEAARETTAYHRRIVADLIGAGTLSPVQRERAAALRYQVMSSVPEHWIPFLAVRATGSQREIELQRGAMPRLVPGDPRGPVPVPPRTALLRAGLDRSPPEPYFVHEEAVPRAGRRAAQAFYRTRWYGGRVVTWLAATAGTGRDPGSSGLVFDTLDPVLPE